jgi:hypothetical protein
MGHRKKRQPGPQRHAEGQHGEKTRKHFIEQLQASMPESDIIARNTDGHQRLREEREQHDEAEKNSEKLEADR